MSYFILYFKGGISISQLTRFERTRLISARALQLSLGAPAIIKIKSGVSMIDVAKAEYENKAIPMSVLRKYPNGKIEKVELN